MNPRISIFIALLSIIIVSALAANDSFVGKWKFDPDKSQLTGLDYKIEDAGGGRYNFVFGNDVETLTLDGKEHLTKYGENWSIKATGPNSWVSTTRRDGKVTAKSNWSISQDGQTFTSIDENMRPDGTTGRSEATMKRTGGSSGIVGTWESTMVKVLTPNTMEVTAWKGDGYSLIDPAYKGRLSFKPDGKEYMPVGPRVAKGTAVTASKTDDRNLELTYKLKGTVTETHKLELSADGKTLTETITYPGVSKPEVDVYDRQ